MDLQTLYQSVDSFWGNISPILFAHLFLVFAWIWARGKNFNFLEKAEAFLGSSSFQRWKKLFDEFELMPKIPLILLVLSFFYFAMLNSFLDFFAGGLISPLSVVYTETDFWAETNDGAVNYDLLQIAAYQNKPNSRMSDVYNFKSAMLDVYKTQFASRYSSATNWLDKLARQWGDYYQVSYMLFALFLILLVLDLRRKKRMYSFSRLMTLLVIILISTIYSRYQTEHYIEKRLKAELIFVVNSLQADKSIQESKLSQEQLEIVECNLFHARDDYKNGLENGTKPHDFWISRLFEGFVKREFPRNSLDVADKPESCAP